MRIIFGGLIKFLVFLLLLSCTPKPPQHPAIKWCSKMCESENLGLIECNDEQIVFLSFRKVGIGEARRYIVRMVRSLEKEGLRAPAIRIMFKEQTKRDELRYVRGYIAEVVYSDNQIYYGMMGNIMQQVQREDYEDAIGRAVGYPAPIDPIDPPKE